MIVLFLCDLADCHTSATIILTNTIYFIMLFINNCLFLNIIVISIIFIIVFVIVSVIIIAIFLDTIILP